MIGQGRGFPATDLPRIRELVIRAFAERGQTAWIQLADTGSLRPLDSGDVQVRVDFSQGDSPSPGGIYLINGGPAPGDVLIAHRIVDERAMDGRQEYLHAPEMPSSLLSTGWAPVERILGRVTAVKRGDSKGAGIRLTGILFGMHSALAWRNARYAVGVLQRIQRRS